LQEGSEAARVADQRDPLALLGQPLRLRHGEPGLPGASTADDLQAWEVPPLRDPLGQLAGHAIGLVLGLSGAGDLLVGVEPRHQQLGELVERRLREGLVAVAVLDGGEDARREVLALVRVHDLLEAEVVGVVALRIGVGEDHEVLDAGARSAGVLLVQPAREEVPDLAGLLHGVQAERLVLLALPPPPTAVVVPPDLASLDLEDRDAFARPGDHVVDLPLAGSLGKSHGVEDRRVAWELRVEVFPDSLLSLAEVACGELGREEPRHGQTPCQRERLVSRLVGASSYRVRGSRDPATSPG
jgi:hypothetical protein